MESKIDGEQRKASFNKINEMIPNRLGDLSDLSNTDKRNIESFINIPENQNAVMELYFRMLPVQLDNVQQETKIRNYDKKVFNKVKGRIEGKYDKDARGSWELDNKIFTDNFFTTWIEANPDWDGSDAQDDTKIKEMHKDTPHEFSTEQFTKKFEAVNKVRKENNDAKLSGFDIVAKLGTETMGKITRKQGEGDQKTVYYDKGDGNDPTVLTADNFMQELNINAESVGTIEGTLFGKGELEQGITNQKDNRFGKIVGSATEITEPEPPQVESLEASDIQINLFNNISADDVKSAVDAAIANLSAEGLDQATKEKFAERIKEVTAALKDGGEALSKSRKPGHEKIKQLQETMNDCSELNLTKKLIPDGKLGKYTFFVMKNYMGLSPTQGETILYERGGSLSGRQQQIAALIGQEGNEDALRELGVEAADGEDINEVALNLIDKSKRREYLTAFISKKNFPGKDFIQGIINQPDPAQQQEDLKSLQLQLIPYYRGRTDGLMGPLTLTAIENYVKGNNTKNDNSKNSDDIVLKPDDNILRHDHSGDPTTTGSDLYTVINKAAKHAYFKEGSDFTYTDKDSGKITIKIKNGESYTFDGTNLTKVGDESRDASTAEGGGKLWRNVNFVYGKL